MLAQAEAHKQEALKREEAQRAEVQAQRAEAKEREEIQRAEALKR